MAVFCNIAKGNDQIDYKQYPYTFSLKPLFLNYNSNQEFS